MRPDMPGQRGPEGGPLRAQLRVASATRRSGSVSPAAKAATIARPLTPSRGGGRWRASRRHSPAPSRSVDYGRSPPARAACASGSARAGLESARAGRSSRAASHGRGDRPATARHSRRSCAPGDWAPPSRSPAPRSGCPRAGATPPSSTCPSTPARHGCSRPPPATLATRATRRRSSQTSAPRAAPGPPSRPAHMPPRSACARRAPRTGHG